MSIQTDFEAKHIDNLLDLEKTLIQLYEDWIDAYTSNLPKYVFQGQTFSFKQYPSLSQRTDVFLADLRNSIISTCSISMKASYELANEMNDLVVSKFMGKKDIPEAYLSRNFEAYTMFVNRVENGMNLSDRVWKHTKQYRQELELGLEVGIFEGKSAKSLATDLKQYLNNPDKLFRRVRDKLGVLRESKAQAAFSPGKGVYKSSFKNALRLTQTETNMSYRMADNERHQKLDFVVGIEIKLSKAHPVFDICDELKGIYPKNFVWRGWHPKCICYKTPVLMDKAEFEKFLDTGIVDSKKKVVNLPKFFDEYVDTKREQIKGWKNVPYWVKDNNITL